MFEQCPPKVADRNHSELPHSNFNINNYIGKQHLRPK